MSDERGQNSENNKFTGPESYLRSVIEENSKMQNGVLGIKMPSGLPGIYAFVVKGVVVLGKAFKRCESNLIIYLPDSLPVTTTDIKCDIDGAERNLGRVEVPRGMRLTATLHSTLESDDLYKKFSLDQTAMRGPHVFGPIEDFLGQIIEEIKQILRECGLNVDCAFDRVWRRVVRQFCGGDCERDCSYDCDWWDVDCHGRKIDCERLKTQCKVCETALEWAKPIVKAYLLSLIGGLATDLSSHSQSARKSPDTSAGCKCEH